MSSPLWNNRRRIRHCTGALWEMKSIIMAVEERGCRSLAVLCLFSGVFHHVGRSVAGELTWDENGYVLYCPCMGNEDRDRDSPRERTGPKRPAALYKRLYINMNGNMSWENILLWCLFVCLCFIRCHYQVQQHLFKVQMLILMEDLSRFLKKLGEIL